MNSYNYMPEIGNLVFLQQLLKTYGFLSNNGNGKSFREILSPHCAAFLAINFPALNNLLQMFSNNMTLNGNKPPLLPPLQPSGTSSNMNLSSQHGSNQSLNLQEQQHNLNPSRSSHPSNPNAATYSNESSLLMCATGAYNNAGPNPNNSAAGGGGPPSNHHTQNGGLTPSVSAPGSGSYPPAIPSLYANSASQLSNGGGGGGTHLPA